METSQNDVALLEKAAKYICNFREGLCPMVVEEFSCKWPCSEETLPWQCWIELFKEQLTEVTGSENNQPNRPVI